MPQAGGGVWGDRSDPAAFHDDNPATAASTQAALLMGPQQLHPAQVFILRVINGITFQMIEEAVCADLELWRAQTFQQKQ
ncbi:hypothetical protein [Pseudomonas triticifolii]|uniref:Uncharacterized protein n=1 Tax=Pseudomonas triticifolii TaxID=2762592 RepID=A0ABR7BF88_9PSED|nr:hypothetical protein [Pseudomonas triticifolii]MBC3955856.1 hypothetical protein [Pseudomonas triticifolii]